MLIDCLTKMGNKVSSHARDANANNTISWSRMKKALTNRRHTNCDAVSNSRRSSIMAFEFESAPQAPELPSARTGLKAEQSLIGMSQSTQMDRSFSNEKASGTYLAPPETRSALKSPTLSARSTRSSSRSDKMLSLPATSSQRSVKFLNENNEEILATLHKQNDDIENKKVPMCAQSPNNPLIDLKNPADREFYKQSLPPGVPTFFLSARSHTMRLFEQDKKGSTDKYKRRCSAVPSTSAMTNSTPVDAGHKSLSCEMSHSASELRVTKQHQRRISGTNNNKRHNSSSSCKLTGPQIVMVRSTWRNVYQTKGPTVLGIEIMNKILFREPQLRSLLYTAKLPEGVSNNDQLIRWHHKSVGDMIDRVVKNIDSLDDIAEDIIAYGAAHAQFYDDGMKARFWTIFAEAFIETTIEWGNKRDRSDELRKAWAVIAAFISEKLKQGLIEERKRRTEAHINRMRALQARFDAENQASDKM